MNILPNKYKQIEQIIELETDAKNVKISNSVIQDEHLFASVTDRHSFLWSTSYYKQEIPFPRVDFHINGKKYFAYIDLNFIEQETHGVLSSNLTHSIDVDRFINDTIKLIRNMDV